MLQVFGEISASLTQRRRWVLRQIQSRLPQLLGAIVAAVALTALAEAYLRFFPPKDIQPFLGEQSPLTGHYVADSEFGVAYRSWEAFCDDNADRLREYLPLAAAASKQPVWAFFGNSFVQAPGMLADTAKAQLKNRRIFNLGKNEHLMIRFAQIRELLNHGLAPERIVLTIMPFDTWMLAEKPIRTFHVTSKGALTFEPRLPIGPAKTLVQESRLALAAWIRTNRHVANPSIRPDNIVRGIGPDHLADLRQLFGALSQHCRQRQVPVTVILIPTYEQIYGKATFGFQDSLTPMLRELGYDVCDTRAQFSSYPDKRSLFIPDKHFTAIGNQILLTALVDHLREQPSQPKMMAGKDGL